MPNPRTRLSPAPLARAICLSLLAAAVPETAAARQASQLASEGELAVLPHGAITSSTPPAKQSRKADFHGHPVADDARRVADWVVASQDSDNLPFVIVDKVSARVFVFEGGGLLAGSAPALLGLGRGDGSVAGIGQRRLASIPAEERTTPSGRFVASLGHDFEQDILWVDYGSSLSLHRVITGSAKDRRLERLASASVEDNRISYGCINVPAQFYDEIVARTFAGKVGIVYILPETKTVESVFAMLGANPTPAPGASLAR